MHACAYIYAYMYVCPCISSSIISKSLYIVYIQQTHIHMKICCIIFQQYAQAMSGVFSKNHSKVKVIFGLSSRRHYIKDCLSGNRQLPQCEPTCMHARIYTCARTYVHTYIHMHAGITRGSSLLSFRLPYIILLKR